MGFSAFDRSESECEEPVVPEVVPEKPKEPDRDIAIAAPSLPPAAHEEQQMPSSPKVAVCQDSESEEDVWRVRRPRRRPTPVPSYKAAQPPIGHFASALSRVVTAAVMDGVNKAAAAITHPPSAKSTGSGGEAEATLPIAEGPAQAEAKQQKKPRTKKEQKGGKAEAEQKEQQEQKEEKPKDQEKKEAKQRAPRGTAGTFAGRRPPKDPHKLELFNARKAAHEQAKKEAIDAQKKVPTLRQKDYWSHLSTALKGAGGDFAQVARKRPAAAMESTPPPKTKGDRETPEKKAAQEVPAEGDGQTPQKAAQEAQE